MRRRLTLCVATGAACAATAAWPAPAQDAKKAAVVVEVKTPEGPPPPRPADRAVDAMKREVRARAGQQEAVRAKIQVLRPAVVAPAPAQAAVAVNANFDNQAVQFRRQYRQALLAEYQRLLAVCEPTKEQRRLIARGGEDALTAAARRVAEMQNNFRPAGQAAQDNRSPRAIIQEGLLAAVKANLSAEQAARFEKEIKARADDFKRAAVGSIVARLDQNLFLTAEQRSKLTEALEAGWNDAWCPSPLMFVNDSTIFPQIPDNFIVPVLDASQKKVWTGASKGQQYFFSDTMFMAADTPLEDAELDGAGKPRPAPGAAPDGPRGVR